MKRFCLDYFLSHAESERGEHTRLSLAAGTESLPIGFGFTIMYMAHANMQADECRRLSMERVAVMISNAKALFICNFR